MNMYIIFFPDSDYEYAVKLDAQLRQVCVDKDGVESPFNPTSNTFLYCHVFYEKLVVPEGMNANDVIIARLKELMEEVKSLPIIYK